jgi:hypothetical protein
MKMHLAQHNLRSAETMKELRALNARFWNCIQAQLTSVAPEHQPADDTIIRVYIEGKRQERLS